MSKASSGVQDVLVITNAGRSERSVSKSWDGGWSQVKDVEEGRVYFGRKDWGVSVMKGVRRVKSF
jgi:hypothetical protein